MTYGRAVVTAEEIIRFGREFDPEPFHIGEEEAKETMFGGLIASGIHMAAMLRRMQADGFGDIRSQGSPGWDKLQFLAPTRPGDVSACLHQGAGDARLEKPAVPRHRENEPRSGG